MTLDQLIEKLQSIRTEETKDYQVRFSDKPLAFPVDVVVIEDISKIPHVVLKWTKYS